MKNLYKIIADHHAPRGSFTGIAGYLIAENEEQVYEFIKDHPSETFSDYIGWVGNENELYWNEETNETDLTHKQKSIRDKGELNCNEYFSDLYYGQTLVGWEYQAGPLETDDIETLLRLKIAIEI